VEEKIELLDRLVAAGLDPARMMPGTGCCALPDSVRLTAHAMKVGCGGVLMLPPFYYKGLSDDGLFRSFAEVIERVGESRLRVYVYHIPPVAQVPITLGVVERLLAKYPAQIAGMKDSGGDWNNTKAFIDAFATSGFDVFAGSETFLLQNMRNGGAGCISATANVNPGLIAHLFDTWKHADADAQQAQLDVIRGIFQKFPMIPALKAAIAHHGRDASWATVRPPLVAGGQQAVKLVTDEEAGVRSGATIMVDGTKVTKGGAAFANAEMAMAGGKWDTFRMLTHPGTSIIPGAFVGAEASSASGRDF